MMVMVSGSLRPGPPPPRPPAHSDRPFAEQLPASVRPRRYQRAAFGCSGSIEFAMPYSIDTASALLPPNETTEAAQLPRATTGSIHPLLLWDARGRSFIDRFCPGATARRVIGMSSVSCGVVVKWIRSVVGVVDRGG
jgi:hypothetical protein